MYIRQTAIKSRRNGDPYQTHRLVESVREGQHVRQRTIVNLGSHFNVPREQWPALVLRIEQIVSGQQDLLGNDLKSRTSSPTGSLTLNRSQSRYCWQNRHGPRKRMRHKTSRRWMSTAWNCCDRAVWVSNTWLCLHCSNWVWIAS